MLRLRCEGCGATLGVGAYQVTDDDAVVLLWGKLNLAVTDFLVEHRDHVGDGAGSAITYVIEKSEMPTKLARAIAANSARRERFGTGRKRR